MSYSIGEITISKRLARIERKPPVGRFLTALQIRPNSQTEAHIKAVYSAIRFSSGRAKLLTGIKLILDGVRPLDIVQRIDDPQTLTLNQAKLLVLSRILGDMDKAKQVIRIIEPAALRPDEADKLAPPRSIAIFDALIFGAGNDNWKGEVWQKIKTLPANFSGLDVTLSGLLPESVKYPGEANGSLKLQVEFLESHLPAWKKIFFAGGHLLRQGNLSHLVNLALDKLNSDTPEERVEGALWLNMCDLHSTLLERILLALGHKPDHVRNRMGTVLIDDGLDNPEQALFVEAFRDQLILPGSDQTEENPREDDVLIY